VNAWFSFTEPKNQVKHETRRPAPSPPTTVSKAKSSTGKRKRINKDDIGAPTDFKHIQHVSFNKEAQKVLDLAQVSEKQIEDNKDFIDNFLKTYEPFLDPVVPDKPYLQAPAQPPIHPNQVKFENFMLWPFFCWYFLI
jgi:hypothetical protein